MADQLTEAIDDFESAASYLSHVLEEHYCDVFKRVGGLKLSDSDITRKILVAKVIRDARNVNES